MRPAAEAPGHATAAPGVCLHRGSAVDDPRSTDTPIRATPAACCVAARVERTAREEFHKAWVPGPAPTDLAWIGKRPLLGVEEN